MMIWKSHLNIEVLNYSGLTPEILSQKKLKKDMNEKGKTQSFDVGALSYNPGQYEIIDAENEEPVKVIDMEIDGRVYHVPIEFYNENIEKGKTKFATMNGRVIMLTDSEYDMMQEAIKAIKMRRK